MLYVQHQLNSGIESQQCQNVKSQQQHHIIVLQIKQHDYFKTVFDYPLHTECGN